MHMFRTNSKTIYLEFSYFMELTMPVQFNPIPEEQNPCESYHFNLKTMICSLTFFYSLGIPLMFFIVSFFRVLQAIFQLPGVCYHYR
jgi:hypothetical protein